MSKDLFLEMRHKDVAHLYPSNFTKKEAIKIGVEFVAKLQESGEFDKLQIFTNIVRLKEVVNSIDSEFRKIINFEKQSLNGVDFTLTNGGNTNNYCDDPIWSDINKELKEREELLKIALKSNKEIYDETGVEVPKISTTPRKDSVTVKF